VRFRSGTDIALLWGIANEIVKNDWHAKDFIAKKTYGFEKWWDVVKDYTPEVVEDITWVPAATIRQLAYDWSHPPGGKPACICWAMGATQHTVGTNNIRAMACMELLCGHVGKPGGGTNAFRGHDNVQGSSDTSVLSHLLPAYYGLGDKDWKHWISVWNEHAPITFEELKAKFAEYPAGSGKSLMNTTGIAVSLWHDATLTAPAQPNPIKMCFVWGHSLNSINRTKTLKAAMEKVELLVGVDPHATIAASLADRPDGIIILPASTQFEQDGSVNNSARQTQWRNKIVEPLYESRPDGWIVRELANRLGFVQHFTYEDSARPASDYQRMVSPELILKEFNRGSLGIMHRGKTPERLKAQQLQCATECSVFSCDDCQAKSGPLTGQYWGLPWPCWNEQHPGTPILYRDSVPIKEGGHYFRTRFRYTSTDPTKPNSTPGNPVADDGVSQLQEGGYDEKNADGTDGPGWQYEINESLQSLIDQNICPSGTGRARFRAWEMPDPVPKHREPIESPRPDLIDKYSTYDDVASLYRLPIKYKSIQQERKNLVNDYPFILTSGRQVEHMGGGAETRSCHYLVELQPDMYAEINPTVAMELGISHWDWIWVENLRGRIKVRAYVTERVNEGFIRNGRRVEATIFMPYHWAGILEGVSYADRWPEGAGELAYGESANTLTVEGFDRSTVMQETKAALCKVYKA